MPAVFISYSRRDKDFVQRLHGALGERGYEVWVDWEDIPPSAQWQEEIRGGILSADGVIYVISPDSAASEVCTTELEHAVAAHKRIVPVVCRDPAPAAVPQAAADLNWVFMRAGDDFDASLELLVQALETDLEHVRTHTRIGVEAERWEASGRERSQLLRGAELATDEAWLVGVGEKEPAPTQLQREYLHESRVSATRRQRLVIGGVSLALAVAIALGVIALIAEHAAQQNLIKAKAAEDIGKAAVNLQSDPQTSVTDALDAVGELPDSNSEESLRESLAASHLLRAFTSDAATPPTPDAIWSPDGTRLLVASPQGTTVIYRPGSGAAPITLPPETTQGDVAWDARGDRVVIGGVHPAVYDADNGRLVARLPGLAYNVALSSDGALAATTDGNHVGHVYDVATGRQLASFHPAFHGGVTCFAWAPDNSAIAQCDAESITTSISPSSVDIWSASTGRLLHSNRTPNFVDSVQFSPNSKEYVYTYTISPGSPPNTPGTFVDATSTGAQLNSFPGAALDAVFSPDGSELAYSTLDSNLVYMYALSGKDAGASEPLVGATAAVDTVNFNSTGSELVAGSEDGVTRVYDLVGGNEVETLADGDTGTVHEASFGLGDTEIATTSQDGDARLWSSPNPAPSVQAALPAGAWPAAGAAFTQSGQEIVEAGYYGTGEILDPRNLRLVARFSAPAGYHFFGAGASRDDRLVAAIAYEDNDNAVTAIVEIFDGRTGRLLATVRPPPGVALNDANLNPAGDRLVTIYANGDADQWDPRTGRLLEHLDHGTSPAVFVGYSHNGSLLAILHEPKLPTTHTFPVTTTFPPVTIDLWSARSGHLLRTLTGPDLTPLIPGIFGFAPLDMAFSPSGRAIALVGADANVWAFSTKTGRSADLPIPQKQVGVSVAWSPNGDLLAVGSGSDAFVWSIAPPEAKIVADLQQGDPSTFSVGIGSTVDVGFTSNSQVLATLGDEALEAWNIGDQLQIFDTPATRGSINLAGTEFVASTGTDQLSEYPCKLCGGLSELTALARKVPGA